ncbi:thiol-disulfide isomerase/thioredoxin [Pseudomonas nitritireducens]|uniref:Thiol-disulfide isomerase/thioredoxin n=1 Tax=Pseudomonas nitroreducens TaxID=46680 RepID=A0A7W7KK96_PSENT|nr:TlpA disulfide reductase family protein [Pseudomonas nitritireducens]MBB4863893.1 thiol-disulfide isomerase/thioredoxin [Pseudomonas nitritireducens]
MGVRLRIVMGLIAGLILAGCSADYGTDQHGQKVPAASVDGQWLVINYWAEWCAPCRKEIPELNGLAEQGKSQGFRVLGVNFDGLRDTELAKASQALGVQYTVLADDPAPRYQLPRSEALPVTYIIDPAGKMREQLLGEQTAAGLQARLSALREEKR